MADPIVVDTIAQHLEHGFTISTWCTRCRKWRKDLDLRDLVEKGYGDRPVGRLKLPCEACGTRLSYTRQPPSRHLPIAGGARSGP